MKPPKLVGVYVRPREEHWAELLESVESTDAALSNGRFAPAEVKLPKSRIMPVFETSEGQRVTLEPTSGGFIAKPFMGGPLLESVVTGGMAGGFMPTSKAPPLPLAGGMSPAAWAEGYMARVPEHSDLGSLQSNWGENGQACTEAVRNVTSPREDEWRQRYFSVVRETAAQRDQIYQTPGTESKGPRFYTQNPAWKQEEYHGSLFAQFGQAAEDNRRSMAEAQTAASKGVFAHTPQSRMLAMAGAFQKNGAGLPMTLYGLCEPELSARMGAVLQPHLQEQANATAGGGQPVDRLRATLDFLKKIGVAGGGAMLSGYLQNALLKDGEKGTDLDKLRGDFIKNLVQMGLNQGLEEIIGKDATGILAGTGLTAAFADAARDMLTKGTTDLAAGAENLLNNLPNNLIDVGTNSLLGGVNDKSSAVSQLLAKYKDQIKNLFKQMLSEDGMDKLKKKWDDTWKGVKSTATVKLGLAIGFSAADMVYVNGQPVTRVNDECIYPSPEPPGTFYQGNPTIRINGQMPSGDIHAAINKKGTLATPIEISTNVLMGETSVSVMVNVSLERPQGSAVHYDDRSPGGASSSSVSGQNSGAASSPCMSKVGTMPLTVTGPDGASQTIDVPVYYDPTLMGANAQSGADSNGNPVVIVGPNASPTWGERLFGANSTIFGPDGRTINQCAVEHELSHHRQDYADDGQFNGSVPSGESEIVASRAGQQCAQREGYADYAIDQREKARQLEAEKRRGEDPSKSYPNAEARTIPPMCPATSGQGVVADEGLATGSASAASSSTSSVESSDSPGGM